jgi:hypothetical protein
MACRRYPDPVRIARLAVLLAPLLALGGCGKEQTEATYKGRSVRTWLADLREGVDRDQRTRAVEALSAMGKEAVPQLVETMEKSDDYLQRVQAAGTLHNIGADAESAIPALIRTIDANLGHLSGTAESSLKEIHRALEARKSPGAQLSWDEWWEKNRNVYPPKDR